jgi:hypothetical protein
MTFRDRVVLVKARQRYLAAVEASDSIDSAHECLGSPNASG